MSLRQLHDTLMEFWGLPLNSCTSRCLFGPFNVGLGLFKDCNAKKSKTGQDAPAQVTEGLTLTKCSVFPKAGAFSFRYFGGCESTNAFLIEELRSVLSFNRIESKSFVSCSHMNCCLQKHTTHQVTYFIYYSYQDKFKNPRFNIILYLHQSYKQNNFIILFNLFCICNTFEFKVTWIFR